MTDTLPARPNLDHLRGQAKALLARLKEGDDAAARAFVTHLPEARHMTLDAVRAARFRLADAQSVVARSTGFAGWPLLARHVEQLRALEGEWSFASLEVDGAAVPASMLSHSRLLIDGDRFRMESPEGEFEGIFHIDVEASPARIDIAFVSGPEAGNTSYGIFEHDGGDLTFCLGLAGAERPREFATRPGSGHALERLQRSSPARPANVTGGTAPPPQPPAERADASEFDVAMTPLLQRLQGEWAAVELVRDGKAMPAAWLAHGSRTMTGNEVKVVVGGQTMVHAKVRIDETTTPIAIEYFDLREKTYGTVTRGVMEWVGDEVRFQTGGTLSHWRRR